MSRFAPRVTVAAIVIEQGRFLLVEERPRDEPDRQAVFNQPAGHLEAGESLCEATRRETLEESGWRVTPEAYLGLYINTAPNGCVYHSHTLIARALCRENRRLDEGVVAAHWLTHEEVQALAQAERLRSPLVLRRIEDALTGVRYPLSLIRDLDHPA